MKHSAGNDLTSGSIPAHIVKFALPMLVGLFFNMGYSIINMIWIGNLLGKDAMGAVAVSLAITLILIGILSGSTTAISILVSQYYGAKNFKMVGKVIANSWYLFFTNAALLSVLTMIFRNGLLQILATPTKLFPMASSYLALTLISFFFSYIYQIINSVLSGMGDTKTPVIFLIIMSCANAVLDPILISRFGLNGAAYASILAWIIAIILAGLYINKRKLEISIFPKSIQPDQNIILSILKIGVPSMIQQCITPISLLFITALVNQFGADAISAYGAASKIDYLAIMPGVALGAAASVITGQNIGAGKTDRVQQVFKWGIIICFSVLGLVAVGVEIFSKQILSIFVRDSKILVLGEPYLRINAMGYCIFSISYITNGIINGHRKTVITMAFSIISLILVRIPLAYGMRQTGLELTGIWYAIFITYLIPSLCGIFYCLKVLYGKLGMKKELGPGDGSPLKAES